MTMHGQSGWTVWSVLGVVAILLFFALLSMKLFPPYYDNLKIVDAMENVAQENRAGTVTRRKVIKEMDNKLYIDFAGDVVNLKESTSLVKGKNETKLIIEYEVIVPLAFNISALLEFYNEVSIPAR